MINRISKGEHAVRMQERREDYFDRIAGLDVIYPAAQDAVRKGQLSRQFRRRMESPGFRRWMAAQVHQAARKRSYHPQEVLSS